MKPARPRLTIPILSSRYPLSAIFSGSLAAARSGHATARPARAADRAAIGANSEIDGSKMTAALLAIRLATADTRAAIGLHFLCCGAVFAGLQIFAHDRAHEGARAHCAKLEQAHLLLSQAHLRDRIVQNDPELRMGIDLDRVGTHDAHFAGWGKSVGRPQLCGNTPVISIE